MEEVIGVVLVVFMVVVLPLFIIMHYVTKWKSTRGLSGEEQQMLEDLWDSSERMQSRITVLETILDERAPKWREDERASRY